MAFLGSRSILELHFMFYFVLQLWQFIREWNKELSIPSSLYERHTTNTSEIVPFLRVFVLGKEANDVAPFFVLLTENVKIKGISVIVNRFVFNEKLHQQTEVLTIQHLFVTVHLVHPEFSISVNFIAYTNTTTNSKPGGCVSEHSKLCLSRSDEVLKYFRQNSQMYSLGIWYSFGYGEKYQQSISWAPSSMDSTRLIYSLVERTENTFVNSPWSFSKSVGSVGVF